MKKYEEKSLNCMDESGILKNFVTTLKGLIFYRHFMECGLLI